MTGDRDPFALAMLAAWLNVEPDQIPPENRAHANPHTMEAWRRVGDAALAFASIEALRAERDKFMWQVRDTCTRAEKAEAELAEAKAENALAKQVMVTAVLPLVAMRAASTDKQHPPETVEAIADGVNAVRTFLASEGAAS